MKVLENTPAVLSLGNLCVKNRYSYEWINGQKPHLIENGIRIQCDTENFVPIVVPGLSTSSSSSSHHATSRTPSRQESDYPTSSSSSSSSPTISSSDNETRDKEDPIEHDTSPVLVSSTNVGGRTGQPVVGQANQNLPTTNEKETMIERGNPLFSDSGHAGSQIPEWLREFKENLVDDRVPEHRDSHASSSHEVSLEPTSKRSEDSGKHSVYTHFHKDRNCEICQRTKFTRLRAEDAMAEPYLVQKMLVTW